MTKPAPGSEEGSEPEPDPQPAARPRDASPEDADPEDPSSEEPSPEGPQLALDALLGARSLAELRERYAEAGLQLTPEQAIERAQQDFHRHSLAQAQSLGLAAPEAFEPVTVEREGVTFKLYGVIHGMLGGSDREYVDFVNAPLERHSLTLFENGLNYFYSRQAYEVIPDFKLLGILGSIGMGLYVALRYPLLLWETFCELMGLHGGDERDMVEFSVRFHALDPEVRRAIEPEPILPSRLQIEHELGQWERRGMWAAYQDPFALAPRSLFMAGYAQGMAERRQLSELAVVIGDLHTMEIVRAFEDPALADSSPYREGLEFARLADGPRLLRQILAKAIHLGFAGLAGCLVLVPTLVPLVFLVRYLLGQ